MRIIKAVILTPMDESYEPVHETIYWALRERDIEVVSPDRTFNHGAVWANAVTDAIREADLIVADVSRKNPNVLYELGYAHALRKPTLLLLSADEAKEVPFDLAGYQLVIYDPNSLVFLRHQVMRFIDYQQSRWEAQS